MSDGCGIVGGAAPDGRFVAVGCGVRPTRVWDTSNDQLLAELPNVTQLESGGFISAFPAVSSDGARAAVARGNTTEVYDLPTGRALKTIQHGAPVSAVTFGEGGAVASGAIDGSVHVTQADGNELALQGSGGVDAVEVLPDGRVLVADAQRRLRLYSANGAVVTDLEMPARIISLRREGTRLVALPSYSGPAAPPPLIDLDRPRVIAQLDGHVGLVWSARWVSGGRILTAGADGTARMWDGTSGQPLQVYRGGSRFLADALLSGSMVIAGDADGQLRFWDEASGARLWTLPVHKSAVIGIHVDGEDIVTRGFAGEVSRWRLPNSEQVLDACSRHVRCAIVPR
jgi:WD40 repeat protein